MMPVGTEDRFATIVDIEPTVVDHALEAVLLNLIALAVHPWPLACLQGVLDLRGAPVYQGLALSGDNDHKVPGIIGPRCFPRSAINPGAIRQEGHLGGLKAREPRMLVVVKHAEQAQALLVERTSQGHRIDCPVDDKQSTASRLDHVLAVGHNDLRHMYVGRIIRYKDGLAHFIMGNHGLRARHDAAKHGDLALVHGPLAPISDPDSSDASFPRAFMYISGPYAMKALHTQEVRTPI